MPVGLTTIRTVDVGATVSLDGRSSRDADGDRIAFRWSLISVLTGSSTQILEAAIATPTFVVDVEGTYVLQLVVNDGEIDSLPDTVVIAAVGETPLLPITLGDFNVGKDLELPATIVLGVAAPTGLEVSVTSSDPSKVVLSTDPTRLGAGTVSVPVSGGRTTVPRFYVQAFDDTGQVLLTISAPGYATDRSKVNLFPSGFVIWSPSFTTTAGSSNRVVQLRAVLLNSLTLESVGFGQAVRGGMWVDVDVASSNTTVGRMTTNTLRFSAGTLFANAQFDPLSPGVTEISIGTPEGFDQPASSVVITATVGP